MKRLKENNLWRNNISFIKDTEKVASLQGLIKIIVKFGCKKNLGTFVSCTKFDVLQTSFRKRPLLATSIYLQTNEGHENNWVGRL